MKIGGLQPVTLLDYPQKVAAIVFANNCSMRCPFCYNPVLVLPELIKKNRPLAQKDFFTFLKKRKKYLDGVVITGGEPTCHSDLPKFCAKIKKFGYAVKLDTNGLMPEMLAELIDKKLIDYIALDLKGPLTDYEKFSGVKNAAGKIKQSLALIKRSGLDYEIRSTVVKNFHTLIDLKKMAKTVGGAKKYFLQNFQADKETVSGDFSGKSFTAKEMAEIRETLKVYAKNIFIR